MYTIFNYKIKNPHPRCTLPKYKEIDIENFNLKYVFSCCKGFCYKLFQRRKDYNQKF